jgi:hypothetical protein
MKGFKLVLSCLLTLAFIFVCSVGIADNAAAPAAPADDGGKTEKQGPPKGDVLYKQDFEEEDDTDAFSSETGEVEWQKGGANGSKGCLKVFNPGEGGILSCEKYMEWYDAKTFIDFDYNVTGWDDEFYFMGWANKAGANVVVQVKSWVKGKWAHAQVKANQMNRMGKSGKGDTFKNLLFVATGVEKDCKDPNYLIDNIVITATDKKKDDAAPAPAK